MGRDLAESISSVQVDNEAGARLAMEHLYKLGHRQMAFIRGPRLLADSELRWRGIRNFARGTELKIDPKLVVDLPNLLNPMQGFEAGYKKTQELLETGKAFTAIVCFDDVTALGAMKALLSKGIRVPAQCSVIGFDDTTPAALSFPALTTIRQPMESLGTVAAELSIQGCSATWQKLEIVPVHRLLAPELVLRESTAPPPKSVSQP